MAERRPTEHLSSVLGSADSSKLQPQPQDHMADGSGNAHEHDRLAAIVSSSNDAIIGIDLDGTIESWNQAAERLYGYSEAEVLHKNISLLVPPDRLGEMHRVLERIRRGQRVEHFEAVRVAKDGRLRQVSISVSPVYEGGRIVGAATIVRDNSERKRLEEQSRQYTKRLELLHEMDRKILQHESARECAEFVIRQLVSMVALPRATITVIDFNAGKARSLVSYAKGEFSHGIDYPLEPLMGPELSEALRQGKTSIMDLASLQQVEGLERLQRAESRYVCVVPMHVQNELIGSLNLGARTHELFSEEVLVLARELGDQLAVSIQQEALRNQIQRHAAELEQRVADRTKELAEANAALETFSYSVSHDLRAPLRTMQGFTEALLEDHAPQLDPVGQDYARRVAEAARRLDRLIQDLLSYSRLSQGKVHLEPLDLHAVVREVLLDFAMELEQQKIEVTVEQPSLTVLGHQGTLIQVLGNLVNNAAKFVDPERKPQIRIKAEGFYDRMVRVWVEDNGIGIAPEHQERIFQIFERLSNRYPGTGTGLAIVRKGAERMGGRVGVVSQPGAGSRFWVELPKPPSA